MHSRGDASRCACPRISGPIYFLRELSLIDHIDLLSWHPPAHAGHGDDHGSTADAASPFILAMSFHLLDNHDHSDRSGKRSLRIEATRRRTEAARLLAPRQAGFMAKACFNRSLRRKKSFIIDRIVSLQTQSTPIIASYWPIRDEIDSCPLLYHFLKHGFTCCLPAMIKGHKQLVFRRWDRDEPLIAHHMGIYEPHALSTSLTPDLLFVPLLAFDRQGFRLGYGGGYYDRSLAALVADHHAIITIGLAYAAQEVDQIPREPHDIPLDAILTERELIERSRLSLIPLKPGKGAHQKPGVKKLRLFKIKTLQPSKLGDNNKMRLIRTKTLLQKLSPQALRPQTEKSQILPPPNSKTETLRKKDIL